MLINIMQDLFQNGIFIIVELKISIFGVNEKVSTTSQLLFWAKSQPRIAVRVSSWALVAIPGSPPFMGGVEGCVCVCVKVGGVGVAVGEL